MAYETPEAIAADPTIYSPSQVDHFAFGGFVFVRDIEYEKAWKRIQQLEEIQAKVREVLIATSALKNFPPY